MTSANKLNINQKSNLDYKGSYNRLFPAKISTTAFLGVYTLFLFNKKDSYYGKEIIDTIEKNFEGSWKPSHGIIYPLLRDLEEAGLLEGNWEQDGKNDKRTKRIYKITEHGKNILADQLVEYHKLFIESFNMSAKILNDLYDSNHKLI